MSLGMTQSGDIEAHGSRAAKKVKILAWKVDDCRFLALLDACA